MHSNFDEIQRMAETVYETLGKGLSERHYSAALRVEAMVQGYSIERNVPVNVTYKGHFVGVLQTDLILRRGSEPPILVEFSALAEDQVKKYMEFSGIHRAYIIQFSYRGDDVVVKNLSCNPVLGDLKTRSKLPIYNHIIHDHNYKLAFAKDIHNFDYKNKFFSI
jgi:GxxExxY protein